MSERSISPLSQCKAAGLLNPQVQHELARITTRPLVYVRNSLNNEAQTGHNLNCLNIESW